MRTGATAMTYPQDPFGHNMFGNDRLGNNGFGDDGFGDDPILEYPASDHVVDYPADDPFGAPPPPRRLPPVNTLATLSLLFALLFAPAGAVLGHLGLAQIRRSGQRGRGRAVAGMALSYVVITVALVGLIMWTTVDVTGAGRTATPPAAGTAAPPTVSAGDLAKLLPGIDEVRRITGDRSLTTGETRDHLVRYDKEGTIDRAECWGSVVPGSPDAYNVEALFGFYASSFSDPSEPDNAIQVIQGVAALRDAAAAQQQLSNLLAGWQQCGGTDLKVTFPSGQALTFTVGVPTDAGDGITTLGRKTQGIQSRRSVRAMGTRSNVIFDLDVTYVGSQDSTDRPKQTAVAIAKYILGKIPA